MAANLRPTANFCREAVSHLDMAGSQLDQVLIHEQILTQLDAIGKLLTAIEKGVVSAARPKAKKFVVPRGTASSSLHGSSNEGDSVKQLPGLHTSRQNSSVRDQSKLGSENC